MREHAYIYEIYAKWEKVNSLGGVDLGPMSVSPTILQWLDLDKKYMEGCMIICRRFTVAEFEKSSSFLKKHQKDFQNWILQLK